MIKNLIGHYMTYDPKTKQSSWKWDENYDEGETEQTRDAIRLWKTKQDAIKCGVPKDKLPKR